MSDPRFARLKTDPRFRRIRKKDSKVVVDERFKGIFDGGKKKKGNKGMSISMYTASYIIHFLNAQGVWTNMVVS